MYEWTIKSFVLKTAAFGIQTKIGENIKQHFEDTLNEFKLTEKEITVVTDGGGNVIRASRLLNLRRINCIAHSIHCLIMTDLMTHDDVKDFFKDFLGKLRRTHFALIYKYQELKLYDNEKKCSRQ